MTTKDGSETAILPMGLPDRRAAGRIRLTPEQSHAVEFLRSRSVTTAKVLVGDPGTGKTTVLNKVCGELYDYTVLRGTGGAGSGEAFMASLLRSAGLSPDQLTRSEQENLLTVFVGHQRAKGRRVLIAIDGAEGLSAEDWEELERLHALQLENRTTLELIIVGRPDIYKHIRSPVDGWQCARTSFFALQRAAQTASAADNVISSDRIIVSKDGEVIEHAPLDTRILIGRNEHNDVCLKHPSVSRHHAVIVGTPSGYYIVDLNSKNGLAVNGELVTSAVLKNADVMVVGPYRMKVMISGDRTQSDPRPRASSLSATATMRVKGLTDANPSAS